MTRVSTSECAALISKLVAALEASREDDMEDVRAVMRLVEEAKAILEKIRHE